LVFASALAAGPGTDEKGTGTPAVESKPAAAATAAAVDGKPAAPKPKVRGSSGDGGREIPVGQKSQDVQHLVDQVDGLVTEMTALTNNLKEAVNPQELRQTIQQLNKTLDNASRTLSPEGRLTTTAQQDTREIRRRDRTAEGSLYSNHKGEGSLGMILNDPGYADQIKEALKNLNKLLNKVGGVRFVVNVGAEQIPQYDGGRGFFQLGIWPSRDRYYLIEWQQTLG